MIGELISPTLLGAAIGLMLACAPRRIWWIGLALFVASTLLGLVVPPRLSPDIILAALRISTIAAALSIYAPKNSRSAISLPICLCAGYWLGSCAADTGDLAILALGLSSLFVSLPSKWVRRPLTGLAIKVAASWIIAIAALSLSISLVPTPGYKPDHME